VNVLMVNNYYYLRGGSEKYALTLERALARSGHRVVFLATRHPDNISSCYEDLHPQFINYAEALGTSELRTAARVLGHAIWNRDAARACEEIIARFKPDVAHFHNIHYGITPSVVPVLKRAKVPIVWTLHDYSLICPNATFTSDGNPCKACRGGFYVHAVLGRCKKGSFRASLVAALAAYVLRSARVMRKVNRFVSPSDFLRKEIMAGGISSRRVVHIPNCLDRPEATTEPDSNGYVVYAGRLSREKGVHTLMEAVRALPEVRLKVLGDGPERTALARRAEPFADRVEFLGHRPPREVNNVIASARCCVVPSEWYENYPYAVLEALALGTPVVAARVGGIPELVRDGVTGYLFPRGDVEALRGALKACLLEGDNARKMGARGRRMVEQVNDPDEHCRRLAALYREVIGEEAAR